MTNPGRELERAKAILDRFVVAMPVQVARELVTIVGKLADKVGRQEQLLLRHQAMHKLRRCECQGCIDLSAATDKELSLPGCDMAPVKIDPRAVDRADFS